MKLLPLGLMLVAIATFGSSAHAQLIPISATGYNEDMIVENTATTTTASGAVTATYDAGTNGAGFTGQLYTLFEDGFDANTTQGLPTSGLIGTSYAFQSYTGNNALLLSTNSQRAPSNVGTLTLSTPTSLTQLSLFGSTGNADSHTDSVSVLFADSTTEIFTVSSITQDWFSGTSNVLLGGLSRADAGPGSNTGIDNGNAGKFDIYQDTFTLSDTSAVQSVMITYSGGGTNAIFGISGVVAAAAPEPGTWALLAISLFALALFGARRRLSV